MFGMMRGVHFFFFLLSFQHTNTCGLKKVVHQKKKKTTLQNDVLKPHLLGDLITTVKNNKTPKEYFFYDEHFVLAVFCSLGLYIFYICLCVHVPVTVYTPLKAL